MPAGRGDRDEGGVADPRPFAAEHESRIENLLNFGLIEEVDYEKGYARVRIGDPESDQSILTDWLRWLTTRGTYNRTWHPYEIGELVVVIATSGNLASGVILGAINYDQFPFPDSSVEHDRTVWGTPVGPILDFFSTVFRDIRRDTAIWWSYLKELATSVFRHEIGEDSVITQSKDEIQLRIKDTKLVIRDGYIGLHVKGKKSEIRMTPDNVVVHVHNKGTTEWTEGKVETEVNKTGVHRVMKDSVLSLVDRKGQHRVTAAMVESTVEGKSVIRLQKEKLELAVLEDAMIRITKDAMFHELVSKHVKIVLNGTDRTIIAQTDPVRVRLDAVTKILTTETQGSRLTLEPTKTRLITPQFQGVEGSALPPPYSPDAKVPAAVVLAPQPAAEPAPPPPIPRPDIVDGFAPEYPDKAE